MSSMSGGVAQISTESWPLQTECVSFLLAFLGLFDGQFEQREG
jgi:hypothetical protein